MFLSQLKLDVHHRQVRQDLRNGYDLHRTILRAFPDGNPGRVLFRLDVQRDGSAHVLVQSEFTPQWDQLPRDYARHHCKSLDGIQFQLDQRLRFRLRVNPTKRVGNSGDERWRGRRVGILKEEEQLAWLARRAAEFGFRIVDCRVRPDGVNRAWKSDQKLSFAAAVFDGILEVTDNATFFATWQRGIGSGKAFGFGLLSLARA